MERDGIVTNDRQLACARIDSREGRNYMAAMSAAANYAWVWTGFCIMGFLWDFFFVFIFVEMRCGPWGGAMHGCGGGFVFDCWDFCFTVEL